MLPTKIFIYDKKNEKKWKCFEFTTVLLIISHQGDVSEFYGNCEFIRFLVLYFWENLMPTSAHFSSTVKVLTRSFNEDDF